ncbi:hypothetical protein UFOVP681_2 [uncultured Caudovirales phage]|uniref:Uncharacterized protein n=1 Tax=uncultured Caudovirales phage TaxID=2100421 RepID=A0A6J5NJR1_9CAUD|nr:hypothetical protein UFOVP681_2 [uncultured Caudovirales phage]
MRQIFSPLDGFRSPFGRRSGAAFTPAGLFALSEPGVWYDPSDLTTLFTDTAGTTPVTTPGQTVALALDKSKGLVLGSELVVSPYTGSASGTWALTSTNVTRNGSSTGQVVVNISTAIDTAKRYYVTFTVADLSGDTLLLRIGGSGTAYQVSANGVYTARVAGGGTTSSISFAPWGGSAGQATITNISVKELPGFHATQATLASRPTYGIVPLGGRRNLLTRTEEFDNAAWTKTNQGSGSVPTVTANAGLSPIGDSTAERVQFSRTGTTATDRSRLEQQNVSISAATNYVFSVWMKSFGGTNQTVTLFPNWGSGSAIAVTVTSEWQRFSVTAASGASTTGTPVIGLGYATNSVTSADILIWGAQLELGSTATAYQRVGSTYDVTEAGVASLSYLFFDGVANFMVTPTITPGIDRAQVFAGVRKLSDAASAILVEHSVTSDSNNGSFGVLAPGSGGANSYRFTSRGTNNSTAGTGAFATAPNTSVLTGLGDISGDVATLRRNGAVVETATTDQGTGNFLAYPLYIGRRGGTTVPFNGQLYSLLVRFGTNLDAGTITSTETWVNGKTGAYT